MLLATDHWYSYQLHCRLAIVCLGSLYLLQCVLVCCVLQENCTFREVLYSIITMQTLFWPSFLQVLHHHCYHLTLCNHCLPFYWKLLRSCWTVVVSPRVTNSLHYAIIIPLLHAVGSLQFEMGKYMSLEQYTSLSCELPFAYEPI